MGLWILTQGQQSGTPGLYIGLKTFVLLQVLQHPFENEGRPLPFNWGYWLNPGE